MNLKFRRQYPIGSFILDFVCADLRLVIEFDGSHHLTEEQALYDAGRTELLQAYGYTVMRFSNSDVVLDTVHVLDQIARKCEELQGDTPLPGLGEGQG